MVVRLSSAVYVVRRDFDVVVDLLRVLFELSVAAVDVQKSVVLFVVNGCED